MNIVIMLWIQSLYLLFLWTYEYSFYILLYVKYYIQNNRRQIIFYDLHD